MDDSRAKGNTLPLQGARGPQTIGQDETSASSSTVTACRRCRHQKLRCSRDVPVCKRCKNIFAVCEYPPPPDRKHLASQRLRNAKARAHKESESSTSPHGKLTLPVESAPFSLQQLNDYHAISNIGPQKSNPTSQDVSQAVSEDLSSSSIALQPALRRTTLPSAEVATFLFEVYFSRLYNATLLFHKKTFLADYAANRVPDFVALSVFALASIFLRQSPKNSRQDENEDDVDLGVSMLTVSDSSNQGFEWASAASQRVLMQADVPRLETIQTCQNLAIYWFSVNETDRTYIHSHIAYSTARLLNFHLPRGTDYDMNTSDLSAELERRCYWSSWITNCISQDNATFKTDPWKESVGLMFPSDEDSYAIGNPIPGEYFDENGNIKAIDVTGVDAKPSVMGEFVKLYSLWWEIQRFVKSSRSTKEDQFSKRLPEFIDLDRRLGLIFEHFPADFRYVNTASFLFPKIDPYRLFSLHNLYHLCACALHSSIVPLFSNGSSHPLISKRIVRLSAEESVRHASITLDMATHFLSTRLDTSNIPSIMGYGLFVACTVHFKSLVAQRKFQSRGTGQFKAAISILERLKQYWTPLQGLWEALKLLFASKDVNIENIPTNDSRPPNATEDEPTDIEKIVSQEESPEDTRTTDIFTYVASNETKSDSPRSLRQSNSPAATNLKRSSSHNTPSPQTLVSAPPAVTLEPRLARQNPNTAPDAPTNSKLNQDSTQNQNQNHNQSSISHPFSLPHQTHPRLLSQPLSSHLQRPFTFPFGGHAPQPPSLPPFTSHGPPDNYGSRRMGSMTNDTFLPLRPVAEEYGGIQEGMEAPMGMGAGHMGMYFDPGVAAIDVEMVDSGVLWWDQGFETFDQQMRIVEREVYGFEGFSLR